MTHSYLDPQDVDSGSAKIVFNTTFHCIRKTDACQVKEHRKRSKAACNIKCERTNTTSNDGYAFYRIYFFYHKKPESARRTRK
nr:MAG TPA: hypothetical protein [Caudoviricetes sp.]